MRRDRALAVAVAGSIAYTIVVGAMSSKPTARAVSDDRPRPVAMFATFAGSGTTLRIADPAHIDAIAQWLDDAMENPRPALDLRLLPPPVNQLFVEFASGERTAIQFSGRGAEDRKADLSRSARRTKPVYVVQHEGVSFTADWVPDVLAGYLELTDTPPAAYPAPYQVKPQR